MGNAYPASGKSSAREDSAWDQEADTERESLIEENARLRALVVQLSTLVLRNVVDQHSSSPMQPLRRPLPD
jgi:hypothetical protein